ncbi:MAG TPA: glycosyltransferase [Vicinamibacterales bacterium]|nr:glycosyltransferase [Vicinamibacterales bacterium]
MAVLIPCFNEDVTIAGVVADFRAALPHADIYVFDNGSCDGTVSQARRAGAHVVQEPRRGKGHVLQSMFRTVDADVYVLVDGDGTYPAAAVQSLIEPILGGRADMVIGSRLHPAATSEFDVLNRWGNRFFVLLSRLLFRMSLTDLLSGYRAFTRAVVQHVRLTSGDFQVDTEFTIKTIFARFRVIEVPVNLRRRPPGSRSKIRPARDGFAIIRAMLTLRARRPSS